MQNDIVSQNEEIISVGELNRSAKYLLENNLATFLFWVKFLIWLNQVLVTSTSH